MMIPGPKGVHMGTKKSESPIKPVENDDAWSIMDTELMPKYAKKNPINPCENNSYCPKVGISVPLAMLYNF